jgi:DNA mismatch repair protein MutS2
MSADPDVLYAVPRLVCAAPKSKEQREALTFAFARGVDRDHLMALMEPGLGPSTFDPATFHQDLFLSELIDGCFKISIKGKNVDAKNRYFHKLLTHPPADQESVAFRCEVQRELTTHKERRTWLEDAYLALIDLRDALSGATFAQRSVGVRRRIDILVNYKKCLDALYRACSTSQSGLRRIADWVQQVTEKKSHASLVQLLDFEGGRAVLETRLQTGYDGTLRRFEIVGVSLTEHRAFPRGPLARFFRSVWSLVKGFRFSEEDIMSQVLDEVFGQLEDEVTMLLGLLLQLEFYLRAAGFVDKAQSAGYDTSLATFSLAPTSLQLRRLFNPWLLLQKNDRPVPCDLSLGESAPIVILTGPNSGGKTRLLQALAATQLLAQAGLPVPAEQACLGWAEQLFLSMIEHVQADQSEGRLGLELMRIRKVFETSGKSALILMDELCSGTNPSEGERIFEMVLELLEELGARVWITTHFLDFAQRLEQKKQAVQEPRADTQDGDGARSTFSAQTLAFLQVELDAAKRPTYQFVPGVAETSLARNTAARLGVTREELRGLILAHAGPVRPA